MKRILKVIFFLGIGLGSFLIGDSIIFYAKGYIGQKLLNYAWNESKITENNIPINIAVIDTATVIKNAVNSSSPQPFEPK